MPTPLAEARERRAVLLDKLARMARTVVKHREAGEAAVAERDRLLAEARRLVPPLSHAELVEATGLSLNAVKLGIRRGQQRPAR